MPNNPIRFRRGYSAALSGERRMKRRNVASTIAVQNKARSYAGQELGSPNGGPASIRTGGGGGIGGGGSDSAILL